MPSARYARCSGLRQRAAAFPNLLGQVLGKRSGHATPGVMRRAGRYQARLQLRFGELILSTPLAGRKEEPSPRSHLVERPHLVRPVLQRLTMARRRIRVLQLQPIARPAASVARAFALRDDPLEAKPAGMLEHAGAVLVVDMLVEFEAKRRAPQQFRQ